MDIFVWYGYFAAAFVAAALGALGLIPIPLKIFRCVARTSPCLRRQLGEGVEKTTCPQDKTAKNRLIVVLVCYVALLIPFGKNGFTAASVCFALLDTVSVSLLFGLGFWVVKNKTPFRVSELLAFVILEIALALTELGIIPFDLYGIGYEPLFAVCFTAVLIAFFRFRSIYLLLLGCLMFRIGFYENIFDVFVDPILAAVSFGLLLQKGCRAAFFR